MPTDDLWYCRRKCELFIKCFLSHSQSGYTGHDTWKQHRDNSQNTLEQYSTAIFQGNYDFIFWACGFNKCNKFNEGNLVFADVQLAMPDSLQMWSEIHYFIQYQIECVKQSQIHSYQLYSKKCRLTVFSKIELVDTSVFWFTATSKSSYTPPSTTSEVSFIYHCKAKFTTPSEASVTCSKDSITRTHIARSYTTSWLPVKSVSLLPVELDQLLSACSERGLNVREVRVSMSEWWDQASEISELKAQLHQWRMWACQNWWSKHVSVVRVSMSEWWKQAYQSCQSKYVKVKIVHFEDVKGNVCIGN